MPRYSIYFFFVLLLLNCSSKKAEKQIKPVALTEEIYISNPDTLSIEHEMAHQPFLTDTISVEAIKTLFGIQSKIAKEPVPNRFIENQTDTLITVKRGRSYVRLYLVSNADKCFYEAAEIQDALPVLQKSIRIGQTKKAIQQVFPELARAKIIPDYVEIAAGEGTDFLYLIFRNDKLSKVEYYPYLD